ncbi:MAG: hypothetical protein ABIP38_05585 [Steroidobacteraceae bacterium]
MSLSLPGQYAYELSLANVGQQLAAAWNGGKTGNAIWIRLTADGRPVGSPVQITDGQREAYEPDIQPFGDDLLVAWYEKDPSSGALAARLGRFTLQGQSRWQVTLSSPQAKGRNAIVRVHDQQVYAAWIETADSEPALWTVQLNAEGIVVEAAQRRSTVSADTWNLNAAVDDAGTLLVVYDATIGTRAKELHLLAIGLDNVSASRLSSDDGSDSTYPDLVVSGDRAALAWLDGRDGNSEVYLFAGRVSGLAAGVAQGLRVTRTPGQSIGAYAAWNSGRLGLAWCDDSAGQSEIFIQQFDDSGAPLAAARQLTHTSTESSIPAIAAWRDGFALAWNEYQPGVEGGKPTTLTSTAVMSLLP